MSDTNYLETNLKLWNNKVATHLASDFYDVPGFLEGKSSLNKIELDILGDVKGLSILHLQCHFGQDSISLSRMGASVTGVDFSDAAIDKARLLAAELNTDTSFVCCNIYDLPKHLDGSFDFVFTSYGTISWLPDLNDWAKIVSRYLKPGGRFVMAEFHPVVWMFDDEFKEVKYSYFNDGPIIDTETGTYADKNSTDTHTYHCWNHSTSEVLNSLITNGLVVNKFDEYDYSPYNVFQHSISVGTSMYRINHLGNRIPMVFSIDASK